MELMQNHALSDESGPNLAHYFLSPRNKYWCDFISKNQPQNQIREGVGLIQITYFPTDLDQTWHVYFSSPRNKYWHGFIMKNQPWSQNGKRGGAIDPNHDHALSNRSGPNLSHYFLSLGNKY